MIKNKVQERADFHVEYNMTKNTITIEVNGKKKEISIEELWRLI